MKKQKLFSCVLWLALFVAGASLLAGCKDKPGDGGMNAGPDQPGNESEESLLECDWTIAVGDEVVVNNDGLEIVYHLTLNAVKNGGTDTMGEYHGTAYVTASADFSKVLPPGAPVDLFGDFEGDGRCDDAVFTVVPFNAEKIEWPKTYSGEPRLPSLTEKNGMAYGAWNFTGTSFIDIMAQGISGVGLGYEDSVDSTMPVPFAIVISGATVEVHIDYIDQPFKGTVTGSPL